MRRTPSIKLLTYDEQIQILEVKIYEYILKKGCVCDLEYWIFDKDSYKSLSLAKKWSKKKILKAYDNLFQKGIMSYKKCGYDSHGLEQTIEAYWAAFLMKKIVIDDEKLKKYI